MPPPSLSGARIGALILIGASTGGVEALHRLLVDFPADGPPVMLVQHIRGAFSGAFAERLNRNVPARVCEAEDGMVLARGQILVAPGDACHLTVEGPPPLRCRLVADPPEGGHRPAVDRLFRSALPVARRSVAVLLTGMGRDGADGLLALRRAGAHTIAQDRDSSTVWGMPRVAAELDAAAEILPLNRIAAAVHEAAARAAAAPRTGAQPLRPDLEVRS